MIRRHHRTRSNHLHFEMGKWIKSVHGCRNHQIDLLLSIGFSWRYEGIDLRSSFSTGHDANQDMRAAQVGDEKPSKNGILLN